MCKSRLLGDEGAWAQFDAEMQARYQNMEELLLELMATISREGAFSQRLHETVHMQ